MDKRRFEIAVHFSDGIEIFDYMGVEDIERNERYGYKVDILSVWVEEED